METTTLAACIETLSKLGSLEQVLAQHASHAQELLAHAQAYLDQCQDPEEHSDLEFFVSIDAEEFFSAISEFAALRFEEIEASCSIFVDWQQRVFAPNASLSEILEYVSCKGDTSQIEEYFNAVNEHGVEVVEAYLRCYGDDLNGISESYQGKFNSLEAYAEEVFWECGPGVELSKKQADLLAPYIDYKGFAHDLKCEGYVCEDGFIFAPW